MYKERDEISPQKLLKSSTAIILCLLLIAVPLIDRCHAVAAVDDVAVLILLTILLSMGISLVLGSSETPDQFFSNKFPLFKQQHDTEIIEQTIGAWLLADIQQTAISLKDGILSLPKTVVTKAKDFISWLIPNPQSNTIHDFTDGSDVSMVGNFIVATGSVINGVYEVQNIGTVFKSQHTNEFVTDGTCTLKFKHTDDNIRPWILNPYNALDGSVMTGKEYSISYGSDPSYNWGATLIQITEPFVMDGQSRLPGIYLGWCNTNTNKITSFNYKINNIPFYVFNLDFIPTPEITDSAVIGDYDNISGIKDLSKEISGTTIIENQFQITAAGQALNPSGETLDDLINALRDAIANFNQRAEVTAVTDAVAEAGTVTPDYGDFDLGKINLSGLGALLTTRFPFSIPWDLGRIFGLFVADPEPPRWEFDLIPIDALSGVDTTITLDLGDYPIVGQISRWFCIIDLCIGLCYVTKRLIWVA